MSEIPTPETDAVDAKQGSKTRAYSYLNMRDHAIDLERRLTIARDALKIVAKYPIARTHLDGPCLDRFDILEVCLALALTATEP